MNQHRLSISYRVILGVTAVSLVMAPALADPPHGKGRGKNKPTEAGASANGGSTRNVSISVSQARGIALEVGATGYRPLPPGIRKNLARGKPLPPGIAKKYAPAPMVSRLPTYPGHEWRVVGTDLVLIAVATAIVVDVLADVFR